MALDFVPFEPNRGSATFAASQALMSATFQDQSASTADFLDWWYLRNHCGPAYGYIVYDGPTPVAHLFMLVQEAIFEGELRRIAVLSNAVTVPSHRGQGIFPRLLERFVEDARKLGVAFIWGYPNVHALSGYFKVGFDSPSQATLELAPVSIRGIFGELRNRQEFTTDAQVAELPADLSRLEAFEVVDRDGLLARPPGNGSLGRDDVWRLPMTTSFMSWRFLEHPTRTYHLLRHRASGHLAVLRFIQLFGMRTALLMKSDALDPRAYRDLLADLRHGLRGQASFVTTLPSVLTRPGFARLPDARFHVPHRFAPRKFPLVVRSIDAPSEAQRSGRFDFVLGDYEVF